MKRTYAPNVGAFLNLPWRKTCSANTAPTLLAQLSHEVQIHWQAWHSCLLNVGYRQCSMQVGNDAAVAQSRFCAANAYD